MRITQNHMTSRLLADLNAAANRLDQASAQMSTQKKLTKPSDDPVAAQRAVLTRGQISGTDQYQANVSQAQGFLSTSDAAMDDLNKLLSRANELTIQAANGATGDEARKNIAQEIDQITAAVKSVGNTSYGGVYIFSGTATTTQPYDIASSPAVDTYAGNDGVIARAIGPGVSVQVNTLVNSGTPPLLGAGGGDGGLIDTLRTISAHLTSGSATDANALGTSDLKALSANLTALSTARAVNGATVNRLTAADSRLSATKSAATQLLSDTEDVDLPEATLKLNTAQNVYQAALKAGATIISPSLLDFLS